MNKKNYFNWINKIILDKFKNNCILLPNKNFRLYDSNKIYKNDSEENLDKYFYELLNNDKEGNFDFKNLIFTEKLEYFSINLFYFNKVNIDYFNLLLNDENLKNIINFSTYYKMLFSLIRHQIYLINKDLYNVFIKKWPNTLELINNLDLPLEFYFNWKDKYPSIEIMQNYNELVIPLIHNNTIINIHKLLNFRNSKLVYFNNILYSNIPDLKVQNILIDARNLEDLKLLNLNFN